MSTLPLCIPNDSHYIRQYCRCGCPPSTDCDTVPDLEADYNKNSQDYYEYVENTFSFINKSFDKMSINEKKDLETEIRNEIYNSYSHTDFSESSIQNLVHYTLLHPEFMSLRQALNTLGWNSTSPEFEYVYMAVLNNIYKARWNLVEPIRLLIEEFGADPNHHFVMRFSPDLKSNDEEIRTLGEAYNSFYPLHMALYYHMPVEVCQYLVSVGADPTKIPPYNNENRVFSRAIGNHDARNIEYFNMYRYIDPKYEPFTTICDWAQQYPRIANLEAIKRLGYNMNVSPDNSWPPMHCLFSTSRGNDDTDYGKYIAFRWFMDNGYDINIPNKYNHEGNTEHLDDTLLHIICKNPFKHYTHPLVRDHLSFHPGCDWMKKNASGKIPVVYLLEHHMGKSDTFSGCMCPNFLCGAIIQTGLRNLPVEYLQFATTILYLKYKTLQDEELGRDYYQSSGHRNTIQNLILRELESLDSFVDFDLVTPFLPRDIKNLVRNFIPTLQNTVETFLEKEENYKMVCTAIMSDSIRREGDSPPVAPLYDSDYD